ncbi:MAG: ribosomal protein L7Ae family protein [Tenericutes bacterium ADurb.Bin087]|nr:MAG: ribosomal protein L7Ae family protein [Tenericutes bacterium ADurb.Bin087]
MRNELTSFLHLLKRSGHYRFGADYLSAANAHKIALVLTSDDLSEYTKTKVNNFTLAHNITQFDVPANIMSMLYPGKTIKVLIVTNHESAHKIANLMKEGNGNE